MLTALLIAIAVLVPILILGWMIKDSARTMRTIPRKYGHMRRTIDEANTKARERKEAGGKAYLPDVRGWWRENQRKGK